MPLPRKRLRSDYNGFHAMPAFNFPNCSRISVLLQTKIFHIKIISDFYNITRYGLPFEARLFFYMFKCQRERSYSRMMG